MPKAAVCADDKRKKNHEKTERTGYKVNMHGSTVSPGPSLVVSSTLLILIRLVGGGWGWSRRGSVSVPLVAVSGLQVLVFIALRQAVREAGLLRDQGGSGSRHRELRRDVGLGRGGEVGDCICHRLLVNNGRGEGALNGVGLKEPSSAQFSIREEKEYPHLVDGIRLNPNTGVSGRNNFDIGLSDIVCDDFLDRVSLGHGRRVDRETGGGDGDGQGLSVGDIESLDLDIGLCHSVVDRGRDGLKLSKIKNHRGLD